jgi:hypothetical protein
MQMLAEGKELTANGREWTQNEPEGTKSEPQMDPPSQRTTKLQKPH